MASVTYQVVEHDGGYAYKVGDVFSETYPTREAAHEAAEAAARRQQVAGGTEPIQYEDAEGNWHTEIARGDDRPSAEVSDGGRARRYARPGPETVFRQDSRAPGGDSQPLPPKSRVKENRP